jgi:splicing factor 3A subunit 2
VLNVRVKTWGTFAGVARCADPADMPDPPPDVPAPDPGAPYPVPDPGVPYPVPDPGIPYPVPDPGLPDAAGRPTTRTKLGSARADPK